MPSKKFDKKKTVTFSVVHRSHEDPLYHDADAGENVLVEQNNHELGKEQKRAQREERRLRKQAMTEAALEERKEYMAGRTATEGSAPKRDTTMNVIHFDDKKIEKELKEQGRRDNEGEAALYGISFDDSKYDYMQHLKPIGETKDAVFISKRDQEKKKNGKKSAGLLLNAEYAKKNNVELLKDIMPSETTVPRNFDSEKNIPDALAGFNPDMDPGLREVLEALEDEEYVTDGEDDNNENLFNELLASGEADTEDEFGDEDDYCYDDEEDYDGQVSDFGGEDYDDDFERSTEKSASAAAPTITLKSEIKTSEPVMRMRPTKEGYEQEIAAPELPEVSEEQHKAAGLPALDDIDIPEVDGDFGDVNVNDASEQDWEKAFKNFKIDQAKAKDEAGFGARDKNGHVEEYLESEAGDGLGALSVVTSMTRKTNMTNKKWRKSKGKMIDRIDRNGLNSTNSDALTEITGLSMSSSANFRNKHLTMLDDRFDTIEEEYFNDFEDRDLNDDTVIKYGLPKQSKSRKGTHKQREEFDMSKERPDLESILDDFLDNHAYEGRKFYKK